MLISNYHTHSFYSDGTSSLEEYVKEAIKKGLLSLGFSCHAPLPEPFSTAGHMKKNRLHSYLEEIKTLKKKYAPPIEIYAGLEVDFIPDVSHPKYYQHQLDYTIGSIHFLGMFNTHTPFVIDESKEIFDKGLHEIFKDDIKKLVRAYYKTIREMITQNPPDIIGHLDLVKKWNKNNVYFCEDEDWYKNEIFQVLESIQQSKCILEVNTSGYYNHFSNEFYPSNWIIQECKKREIPLIINSDAHSVEALTNNLENARNLLLQIGYTKIALLKNTKWELADL